MTSLLSEPRADAIAAALNAITLGGDLASVFATLTPSERAALAKILDDRRLATEWRKKARKKQLPPSDQRKPLSEWDGYVGFPPGCPGPETCNQGTPEHPDPEVRYCDHRFGSHTYRTCYKQGGRGAGKTWTGAHALCELVLWLGGVDGDGKRRQYAIVGPTHNTAWDVCVENGIKTILGDRIVKDNKGDGIIEVDNGAIIYVTGAKTGAPNLQGKNLTAVWADEVGVWEINPWFRAWVEGIEFATRKTPHLVIATGTPKQGHPLVAYLVNDPTVHRVVMPTKDNRKNLGPAFLARLKAAFGGARIGQQELDGEFLTDTPGALWTLGLIDSYRVGPERPPSHNSDGEIADRGYSLPEMKRIVVGWDPANTANSGSDEHGIFVEGIDENDHVYVIADYSGVYSPDEACRKVAWAHDLHDADVVVVEKDGAQDWIFSTVEQAVPSLLPKVKKVSAKRNGKWLRAEPIVAITEQGRLHMLRKEVQDGDHGSIVDHFDAVIGQMTTWLPTSKKSPDRMDALVYAATELLSGDGGSAGSHVIVPGQSQGRGFLGAGRGRRR